MLCYVDYFASLFPSPTHSQKIMIFCSCCSSRYQINKSFCDGVPPTTNSLFFFVLNLNTNTEWYTN